MVAAAANNTVYRQCTTMTERDSTNVAGGGDGDVNALFHIVNISFDKKKTKSKIFLNLRNV